MDDHVQNLLMRWESLTKGDGLRRARLLARVLWFVGLGLWILVIVGVTFGLHPIAVAVAAAVSGWVTAECNALRTRLAQWPILRRYIDWNRVEADLTSQADKA